MAKESKPMGLRRCLILHCQRPCGSKRTLVRRCRKACSCRTERHAGKVGWESESMDALLAEYLPILIFLGIAVGLSVVIVAASYILARQRPESETVSAYACR